MGRSVENKAQQIQYIQQRVELLRNVVSSLDDSADSADLHNILEMLRKLQVRITTYAQDWETK